MENCNLKKPSTPERMLSESDEEALPENPPIRYMDSCTPEPIVAHNMPRIADMKFKSRVQDYTNNSLSALAKGLESNNLLKDGFNLDELKKKQNDLMHIQEMVQK